MQTNTKLSLMTLALATCAAITLPSMATAQTWPARSVRIIVPFPPGGSPERLGAHVKSEIARWGVVVKAANIRVE